MCHIGWMGFPEECCGGCQKSLLSSSLFIYYQSWLIREVPDDLRLTNAMPIHKKGWKDGLGSCRPISLTMVPREGCEDQLECIHTAHAGQPGD